MSFSLTKDKIKTNCYSGEFTENLDKDDLLCNIINIEQLSKKENVEVLKSGRNIIYKISVQGNNHELVDCALKYFLKDGVFKRFGFAFKGSKAKRTWENSMHLATNGIGVSFPFLFADLSDGKGVFVSQYLDGRISLRDKLIDILINNPNYDVVSKLLEKVSESIRLMHETGFQHNDLGNQNILLKLENNGDVSSVEFIDLNRGYIRTKLSSLRIARDLSRLTLPGELLEIFNKYYFENKKPSFWYCFVFSLYMLNFKLHTRTRKYRHPIRERKIEKDRLGRVGYPEKIILKDV
jgi:hypothetical protein